MPAEPPFIQVKWQKERDITTAVQSIEIEDNDRLADKATIVVSDPQRVGMSVVERWQTIKIDLGWTSEHAVLFEGTIAQVNGHDAERSSRQLTIVAYDKSYLMNIQAKTREHTGTLNSILTAIVGEYPPLTVGQIEPSPDTEFPATAPLRQVNRTDLQFIQDIASHYGARAFVEYNEGASKFYFVQESRLLEAEKMGHLRFCSGLTQLIEFDYQRVSSGSPPRQAAATHDPATGETVTSPPPVEPPPPVPATDATLADELGRRSTGGDAVLASGMQVAGTAPAPETQVRESSVVGLPSNPALPASIADRRDRTRILGLRGTGLMVGSNKMRAKGKVGIEGIAAWATGDWYVTLVKHLYRGGPQPSNASYQTRFIVTR